MYCGNSMSTMIKCSNCGADFEPKGDRCPYCGYIYEIGAQQKYMSDLIDIREALDVVDEEQVGRLGAGSPTALDDVIGICHIYIRENSLPLGWLCALLKASVDVIWPPCA